MTEREAWAIVLAGVGGPLLAWSIPALLPMASTSAATLAGVALELLGIFVVARQIHRARQQHHAPSLRGILAHSLRQMPSRVRGWIRRDRQNPITFSEGAVGGVSFTAGKAYTWMSPPPSLPPGEQIRHLDEEVQRAIGQQRTELRQVEQSLAQLRDRLTHAERDLRRTQTDHRDALRDLATADTGMEVVGLIWVAVGLVLSAWPSFFGRFF